MKSITLTFFNRELFYDIMNITHIVAKNRRVDDEAKYNIQISDEADQYYFVSRSIKEHWGDAKNALRKYISETKTTADNTLEDPQPDYTVTLELPDTFKEGITQTINNKIHDYIVYSTLYDWFLLALPEEDIMKYKLQAEESLNYLKNNLASRAGYYELDSFPKYREL